MMGLSPKENILSELNYSNLILITTKDFNNFIPDDIILSDNIFIRKLINGAVTFNSIIEVDELIDANGSVIKELTENTINKALRKIFNENPGTIIIAFMNSNRNPLHENIFENILRTAGYTNILVSHKIDYLV